MFIVSFDDSSLPILQKPIDLHRLNINDYFMRNEKVLREYAKRYREAHKKQYQEYYKHYYQNNKEQLKEYAKEHSREYYKTHKEKFSQYYQDNKHKILECRKSYPSRTIALSCGCGKGYLISNKHHHENTRYHQKWLGENS